MINIRLRELRKSKKLTQEDIAKKLKISRPTYTRYEIGDREPNLETVNKLAEIFDVTTDYLLGKTNTPPEEKITIPDELKDVKVAFHNGDLEDLTQDELDRLAEFARFIKSERERKKNK